MLLEDFHPGLGCTPHHIKAPGSVCIHQDTSVHLGQLTLTHSHICAAQEGCYVLQRTAQLFCSEASHSVFLKGPGHSLSWQISHIPKSLPDSESVLSTVGPLGLGSMSYAQPGLKRHCVVRDNVHKDPWLPGSYENLISAGGLSGKEASK